jgi:hypothetical protein
MNNYTKIGIVLCLLLSGMASMAQQAVSASGGNATGSGGSVSYSVGQLTYHSLAGDNGTVNQGVQQPYEISVVTGTDNKKDIGLEYMAYPNPVSGIIYLKVKDFSENLRCELYDMEGNLIDTRKMDSSETGINMSTLAPANYFLKVIRNQKVEKVFKIIKN